MPGSRGTVPAGPVVLSTDGLLLGNTSSNIRVILRERLVEFALGERLDTMRTVLTDSDNFFKSNLVSFLVRDEVIFTEGVETSLEVETSVVRSSRMVLNGELDDVGNEFTGDEGSFRVVDLAEDFGSRSLQNELQLLRSLN